MENKKNIMKRFPADTHLDKNNLTFLSNKKIDGELYALLQLYSIAELKPEYEKTKIDPNDKNMYKYYNTVVKKENLPPQNQICSTLGIKSPKTYKTHLTNLQQSGYIIFQEDGSYLLPHMEDIYMMIPLKTLQYLNNNCKEHVIKIYIYLGQRFNYVQSLGRLEYNFTSEEIGYHLGLQVRNNARLYKVIKDALLLLVNSGLIEYHEVFDGKSYKKCLTGFSFEVKDEIQQKDKDR